MATTTTTTADKLSINNNSGLYIQVHVLLPHKGTKSFDQILKDINTLASDVVLEFNGINTNTNTNAYFNTDNDWDVIMKHARKFEECRWGRKHTVTEVTMHGDMQDLMSHIDNLAMGQAISNNNKIKALSTFLKDLAETKEWSDTIQSVEARMMMQDIDKSFIFVMHIKFFISEAKKGFTVFRIEFTKPQLKVDFRMLKMGIHKMTEKDQYPPPSASDPSHYFFCV